MSRAKHIEVRFNFSREFVQAQIIKLKHVDSNFNAFDGFTKQLGRIKFKKFRNMIGIDIAI